MAKITSLTLHGVGGAAVAWALLAWTGAGVSVLAADEGPGAAPDLKPAGAAAPDDRFEDPEAILKEFTSRVSSMRGRPGVDSPADLARQALANKRAAIETLPDPGEKISPEELYARARRSVVIVGGVSWCRTHQTNHTSCATGFVLHKQGVIVTSYHVVATFRDMTAVGVMTADGRVFPIKSVLAADTRQDVALLKIECDDLAPLPLAATAPVGASIYCLSHPALECGGAQNGFYTFTRGMVSGKFHMRLGGDAPVDVLAITADYAKGSSGGPVLNESGAVVGVVCQTMSVCHGDGSAEIQMTWKFCRPSGSVRALVQGTKDR